MSEEEGAAGPEPAPIPPSDPPPAPADGNGSVLGGIFLIGCGLCLLLVGGGCTTILVLVIIQSHGMSSEGSMLVVSLALAGGGIFAIVQGVRMARGRRA